MSVPPEGSESLRSDAISRRRFLTERLVPDLNGLKD